MRHALHCLGRWLRVVARGLRHLPPDLRPLDQRVRESGEW